jgi:leucyl aminopeptidase
VTFDCDYACSDHASWYEVGFADVACSEDFDSENPNIHSSKDTIDKMDFDLVLEYTKLGLAFAAELALYH